MHLLDRSEEAQNAKTTFLQNIFNLLEETEKYNHYVDKCNVHKILGYYSLQDTVSFSINMMSIYLDFIICPPDILPSPSTNRWIHNSPMTSGIFSALHCITLTSFPKGIQSPFVGACARNSRALSLPGTSGMQSSGFVSFSYKKKQKDKDNKKTSFF